MFLVALTHILQWNIAQNGFFLLQTSEIGSEIIISWVNLVCLQRTASPRSMPLVHWYLELLIIHFTKIPFILFQKTCFLCVRPRTHWLYWTAGLICLEINKQKCYISKTITVEQIVAWTFSSRCSSINNGRRFCLQIGCYTGCFKERNIGNFCHV